ncbi:hypothetical protein Tco_0309557 [Tanacetum coccineum]
MESLNSNSQERELHQLQQMQDNAKESCMVSFQLLHSHLKALSNNDFKGTCIEGGFERAFASLFDQDWTESEKHVISSRSGNDTHADDADIKPVNDKEPMAEDSCKPLYNTVLLPPSRTNWDILFQPLFDELLNPPSSVDRQALKVIAPIAEVVAPEHAASTRIPSSTNVAQDAPSLVITNNTR